MLCGVALVCAQGILNPKHSQVSVYSDQGCVKNGGSGLVAVLDGAKKQNKQKKIFFFFNFMGLVIYKDVLRSIIVTLLYLKSFLKFSS